jgi:hexosaminidase
METMIDLYSTVKADQVGLFTSGLLAAGNHTLKVRALGTRNASSSGTYITADRVDVTQ